MINDRLLFALLRSSLGVALKANARDKREPRRRKKAQYDAKVERILQRRLNEQRRYVQSRLAMSPGKVPKLPMNDKDIEALAKVFTDATRDGINLFGSTVAGGVSLDATLINTEAADAATQYAYELIKGIDNTTRDAMRDTIRSFVDTPGATMGDVIDAISVHFGQQRAANIATTEITRAYATGNQLAGEELAKQYPDVLVYKRWFTNHDPRVCSICKSLDGQEVLISEKFYSDPAKGGDGKYYDNPPDPHPGDRCWTQTTTKITK